MAELIWQQERDGISGGIAEIGVHHGKSFLFLALAARPAERLVAIDLFERQELNTDQSGRGDRHRFHMNLRRFAPGRTVEDITASSTELWQMENRLRLNGIRFLSIDGGHTRELTLNDLRLADALLDREGLCVVDDVLNPHWTGVISGIFEFFLNHPTLVPFAILPNKLALSRPERRDYWRNVLRSVLGVSLEKKDVEFSRWNIDVFGNLANDEVTFGIGQFISAMRKEHAKAELLAKELSAIRASTSWRITEPLRRLRRLVPRPSD
jgi:hypothetical protein